MRRGHRTRWAFIAALVVTAPLLAACSSGSSTTVATPRACVILPDTASSSRWSDSDEPAIRAAIKNAGFDSDIRNAEGDRARFAEIGDELLAGGCGVMIITDYAGAGAAVAQKAKAAGVKVIAYDRPVAGADYLVSFDYTEIGRLQASSITDGLTELGRNPAQSTVYYIGGDQNDTTTATIRDGAIKLLSAEGVNIVTGVSAAATPEETADRFRAALDASGNAVDAVLAGNDTVAAAIIAVLDERGISAIVTGQDATVVGLRNVLLGKQLTTIHKPYRLEADRVAKLAVLLLFGDEPEADGQLIDGTPFFEVESSLLTIADVKSAVHTGAASVKDVCAGDVATICAEYGVN